MGSWNETCMVSHLPVTCGDEVAMTVVTRNDAGEWYQPNSLYYISPFMFYGEYNDYGTSENCHGIGLQIAATEFRKFKTPIDENLSPDQIVEKIAREELMFNDVKTFRSSLMGMAEVDRHARLGFIRKDVLDRILADYEWKETFYEQDADNSYIYKTINYQYYLDCIPGAITRFKEYYKEAAATLAATGFPSLLLSSEPVPDSDMKDDNMVIKWVWAHIRESRSNPFHKSFAERIRVLAETDQDKELAELLAEFSKYCILYKFMMDSRKVFTPQPNTSQDSDTDAHEFLAKITTEIGREMNREWREENEAWDPARNLCIYQHELDI